MHNYAYHLLREGDSEEEILKKLKSYHYPFYEWNLANKETSDAVHKVGLVLKDDGLLRKYIVKYRFKYSHYKKLKKELEATDDKIRIRRALEPILTEPTERKNSSIMSADTSTGQDEKRLLEARQHKKTIYR